MKRALTTTCCVMVMTITGMAQTTPMRVDIDMSGRTTSEVTETGYTSWTFGKNTPSSNLTVNGIEMILRPGKKSTTQAIRTSWYKVGVQSPNFARLVCDGVVCEESDKLYSEIELVMKNLSVGRHTIQTFHNVTDGYEGKSIAPIKISIDSVLMVSGLQRTCRKLRTSESTYAYLAFDIKHAGDSVSILFATDLSDTTKTYDYLNMSFNGFILDETSTTQQAKNPSPDNGDLHVDADSGQLTIQWSKAENAVKHQLFIGYDSLSVANADKSSGLYKGEQNDTLYQLSGLTNLQTYFWRVDEVDASGNTSKGDVWCFSPRHLAFPGAEGYGRFARGGRGGKVVYVTNLNDSGAGSFREAITKEIGPRTILFAVSGRIQLQSRLTCASKFVTIAGESAPGKGICLSRASFGLGSDCICRFMRNRIGGGDTYDGMGIRGGDHSIMDHCSISWSIDEGFSCREAKNVTLQHTMIAEPLNVAGHDKYSEGAAHGFSAVFGGDIGSFHHNIMAHAKGRNPRMDGGMDGSGYYMGKLDIFNNVVYNWSGYAGCGESHEANFVNNYYKKGPATGTSNTFFTGDVNQRGSNLGTESYYFDGNVLAKQNGTLVFDGTQSHGDAGQYGGTWDLINTMPITWTIWVDKPFYPSYAKIESAQDAYKSTLSDIGCNQPYFDLHDQRIVREIKDGTYTYQGSLCKLPGVIDDESDAGGFEDYGCEVRQADYDTDFDGLPDWWERIIATNANSASGDFSDSNADPNHDGFTNLEEYLHWLAVPHDVLAPHASTTIDLTSFTKGYANSPVFSLVNAEGVTASINGCMLTVTAQDQDETLGSVTINVTDAEGSTLSRDIHFHITNMAAAIHSARTETDVMDIKYYDLSGRIASDMKKGVYLKTTIYENGSLRTEKIVKW